MQQAWNPAMPVASHPPFSHVNQSGLSQYSSIQNQTMTFHPSHLRPTNRLESLQLPSTPRPQPMGLWAQSAGKSNIPNPSSMQAPAQHSSVPPATSCQMCNKTHSSLAQVWQHYARQHFLPELKVEYSFMADIASKSCTECGSRLSSIDALFLHIGTVHRKVNEILQKRGLHSLEAPVLRMRKSM